MPANYLSVTEIKSNPNNPRFIKDDKFKKLVQSIKDFPEMADVREIVINKDNIILGGNMRFKAMQEAGWKKVPVRIVDWSDDKQKEFIIKDNVSGGDWDWDILANDWDTGLLDDWGLDLPDSFGEEDIEEDESPEVDEGGAAVSVPGTVYKLGSHRVMCGDSTEGDDVNSLMNGVVATLMVTDPPYGVNYDAAWRNGHDLNLGKLKNRHSRAIGKVSNDNQVDWTLAYELFGGNIAYIWHSALHTSEVGRNLQNLGYDLVTQIIWVKQHFVLSRGDYHWQHEPCWYAVKKGNKHNYLGDRKQTSIWEIRNNNPLGGQHEEKTGHSTQKPIECMAKPIRNNSSVGQAIYDPFGGSGSTLIAAEQLDRICYMMELDPKYVDVIRKRYTKFTDPDNWEATWQQMTPAA